MRRAVNPDAIPTHCFHVNTSRSASHKPNHIDAAKAPTVTRTLITTTRSITILEGVLFNCGGGKLIGGIIASGGFAKPSRWRMRAIGEGKEGERQSRNISSSG
jgi:hypothetical protein